MKAYFTACAWMVAWVAISVALSGCAGWSIAPSLEYTATDGASYKAAVKIKIPKNSNK